MVAEWASFAYTIFLVFFFVLGNCRNELGGAIQYGKDGWRDISWCPSHPVCVLCMRQLVHKEDVQIGVELWGKGPQLHQGTLEAA